MDHFSGKKLLCIFAQFLTTSVFSTDFRGKAGMKACLGQILFPNSVRLGNPISLLGAKGRGVQLAKGFIAEANG